MVSPCWPTPPGGGPPTWAGSFGSVFRGVTAPILCVLVCARFCLCPPKVESLFPLWKVLWKSCNQILLVLKDRVHEDSYSLCQISRQGNLTQGSEPSQQWENFFGFIVLQFVGCPPSEYRIWFYRDYAPPIISLQLLVSLDTRYLFLVCSSILLSMLVNN